jgi:hypothetical protein
MKNRLITNPTSAIVALASLALSTISLAGPVGEAIEDLSKMGARGSGYQYSHDSDNSGVWLLLGGAFIVILILVSILKKNR